MKKLNLKIAVLLFLLFPMTNNLNAQWNQLGDDIDITFSDERENVYKSVGVNSDGTLIAYSYYHYDSEIFADTSGTRIFQYNSDEWNPIGNDINKYGNIAIDSIGFIVAISSSEGIGIYNYNSGLWELSGNLVEFNSTCEIDINSEGNTIIIGNEQYSNSKGYVMVFREISGNWIQIGSTIFGENEGDKFGNSVSINTDGNIIAFGAKGVDGDTGCAKIFRYVSGEWNQIGANLTGDEQASSFGNSISLNANGARLAISSEFQSDTIENSKLIRVYSCALDTWEQVGNDIYGILDDYNNDILVSLTSDASKFTTNICPVQNQQDYNKIKYYLYSTDGYSWNLCDSIVEEVDLSIAPSNYIWKKEMYLSSDGNIIVSSYTWAPNIMGHNSIKVYSSGYEGIKEYKENSYFSIYPNPTSGEVVIEGENIEEIKILDITGKIIYQKKILGGIQKIDLSEYPKGIYLVIVNSDNTISSQKLILE